MRDNRLTPSLLHHPPLRVCVVPFRTGRLADVDHLRRQAAQAYLEAAGAHREAGELGRLLGRSADVLRHRRAETEARRMAAEILASQAPGESGRLAETHGLSTKEVEVLQLIGTGISNAAIAAHMQVSLNTVKTYIRSAYKKIGVPNRSRAVLWWAENGGR